MDGIAAADDVVTAATGLAGLILVYLGTLVAGYTSFQPAEQKSVRGRFLTRAWLSFVGMVFALLSAAMGVSSKWLTCSCLANAAVVLFFIAIIWGLVVAVLTIKEIK